MSRSYAVLRALAVIVFAFAPFGGAAPASAQDTQPQARPARDADLPGIDEIIVTARKREESIQDVPVAITAITGDLEHSGIRDLTDLNGYAPNVRINEDSARSNGASIAIRGISPSRTDDNSLDAPIAVMIDGIHLGTLAGQTLENFDLERVEILRGPQGTLFGKNTVGGVINVIRSRPTMDWGIRAKVTAGSHDLREYRLVLNAPVVEEKVGAKVFFTLQEDDGFIHNSFINRRVPQKDYKNYGITLLATPTEDFEAQLTIERFDDESELAAFLTNYNLAPNVAGGSLVDGLLSCTLFNSGLFPWWTNAGVPCRTSLDIPTTVSTNISNPATNETDAYTLNMRYDINDSLSLVSVTGYRDVSEHFVWDFDGTEVDHINITRENAYDQFSQELRLEGDFDDVTFVAGAYYWKSEYEHDFLTQGDFWPLIMTLTSDPVLTIPTPTGPVPIPYPADLSNNTWLFIPHLSGLSPLELCQAADSVPNNPFGATRCDAGAPLTGLGPNIVQMFFNAQETTSYAAFAQADWEFVENWTVTLGLRWTYEEKEFTSTQATITSLERAALRPFVGELTLDNDWSELSPKFGINWQATDDVMFYFSYSEGFHSGGFFGVNQNLSDFARDQYDPEFATTYELGVKSQLFDNTLQVNFTYFYNDFEDKQESSIQFDPATNTVATVFSNVADAVYHGGELEVLWVPTDFLSTWLSVGYLDAEYDDFEVSDLDPVTGVVTLVDASHLTPRNAPEWTVGVGFTLSYPIGRASCRSPASTTGGTASSSIWTTSPRSTRATTTRPPSATASRIGCSRSTAGTSATSSTRRRSSSRRSSPRAPSPRAAAATASRSPTSGTPATSAARPFPARTCPPVGGA